MAEEEFDVRAANDNVAALEAPKYEVVQICFLGDTSLTITKRNVENDVLDVLTLDAAADIEIVGRNVLTQAEVDVLVEKCNGFETACKTKDDMIASLDAEMTGLRQTNRLLVSAADEARGDLQRHTATGAPSKIADLPTLDKIPPHKSLEEVHAVDAPVFASDPPEHNDLA